MVSPEPLFERPSKARAAAARALVQAVPISAHVALPDADGVLLRHLAAGAGTVQSLRAFVGRFEHVAYAEFVLTIENADTTSAQRFPAKAGEYETELKQAVAAGDRVTLALGRLTGVGDAAPVVGDIWIGLMFRGQS
jgi:hypothetical protein